MSSFTGRALALLLAVAASPPAAWGGEMTFDAGGVRVHATLRSFQEIRQARTVRQRWDLSCGPAALSTLLTHHYGDPVSEAVIVTTIMQTADPLKIRAQGGFSLLDLKRFVSSRGYEGKGYGGMSLKELAELGMPAIVPTRMKGYSHFVVFREMRGDRVILADPAFGTMTMPAHRFLSAWEKGIGFIVLRKNAPLPRGLELHPEEYLVPDGASLTRAALRMGAVPPTRHGP